MISSSLPMRDDAINVPQQFTSTQDSSPPSSNPSMTLSVLRDCLPSPWLDIFTAKTESSRTLSEPRPKYPPRNAVVADKKPRLNRATSSKRSPHIHCLRALRARIYYVPCHLPSRFGSLKSADFDSLYDLSRNVTSCSFSATSEFLLL